MSILFINDDGARISVSGGYFQVDQSNGMIRKIPKETLDAITLFSNSVITTPCIKECLKQGIPVNFFSGKGSYFGKLTSTRHVNANRVKKQVYASDDVAFCLELGKKIIDAKIANQIVVLRRYNRRNLQDVGLDIKEMTILKNRITGCDSIEALMGYEGIAARYYFFALSKLVNPEFAFSGRNRRPPKDPFNSMLSLGYTILMYRIYAEIENRGLSPYIGMLHSDHTNHPTLASDLMEEWRAVIVDATVMSLVQGNEIKPEHFEIDEESQAVVIKTDGMKIFLNKLENKFKSENKYLSEKRCSMNYAIYLQTVDFVKAVEYKNAEFYNPLRIRR